MKAESQIQERLKELTEEYKKTNSYGQGVIGQIISQLCWVLDMNYDVYAKQELRDYDKDRCSPSTLR